MPEQSTEAQRWIDSGPLYKETPPDPRLTTVAEPWNTVTASIFIIIAAMWLIRLRGRYANYPFLTCCMPILLAGGIGGTLYHALRSSRVFFLLDLIPILLLGLLGSIYLIVRLAKTAGVWKVISISVGVLAVLVFVNGVIFRQIDLPYRNLRVNLSYGSQALMILIPMIVVLIRTGFRDVGWVGGSLASFGIAWFCRLIDGTPFDKLSMGTHWLWHVFGAITTWGLTEYFYRLESKPGKLKP